MYVFVTGATGFIGARVVTELLGAGHRVLGLTRSEDGARRLAAAGAEIHHGSIEDLDSLAAGAAKTDGTIHLAFNHDFSRFRQNAEDDRRVIEALGAALAGSQRPLLVTSGTGIANGVDGQPAREDTPPVSSAEFPRAATEEAVAVIAARGVNTTVMRLPQVHDTTRFGLVSPLIEIAQKTGVAAYVGDGRNRWPAAHVDAVAHLYRLALEAATPGAVYHGVAEEGIAAVDIVTAIGNRLGLPVRSIALDAAPAHFGWLAMLAGRDLAASSAETRRRLGWTPTGPGILEDIARFEAA